MQELDGIGGVQLRDYALFNALADHLPDPMFLLDMDDRFLAGKILFANIAALQVYRYEVRDLLGQPVSFLADPTVLGRVPNRLEWIKTHGNVTFDSKHIRKDGSVFPVEVNARLVNLPSGRFAVSIHRDLTSKYEAAEALEEMEARFQSFMENAPAVAFMKDLQGRYIFINKRMKQSFPAQFENWYGKLDDDIWPAATAKALREVDAEVLRTGKLKELIENVPDEHHEWLTYKFPLFNAKGETKILAGMAVDVTALRHVREELRQSREQYRILLEQAADGILIIDQQGFCLEVNNRLCQLFDESREALLCRHLSELIVDELQDRCAKLLESLRSGNTVFGVWRLQRATQTPLHVEVNAKVLSDGRLQAIVRDMSDRLRAEEKERQRQAELAHVARLSTLGQMVAGIAHEISQPLYAITNYAVASAETLKQLESSHDLLDEKCVSELTLWVREIASQAIRAGEVIRRLANFTRKSEVRFVAACPTELMREAADLVDVELRKHGVSLEYDLDSSSEKVRAEPILIEQVLVNLLRNACEAVSGLPAERRKVILRTTRRDQYIEFSICDRGPGVEPQKLSQVFDSFFTTKAHGMGLGLAISRSIIEAHNGRLWAENNSDQGATFLFSLPIESSGVVNAGQY